MFYHIYTSHLYCLNMQENSVLIKMENGIMFKGFIFKQTIGRQSGMLYHICYDVTFVH